MNPVLKAALDELNHARREYHRAKSGRDRIRARMRLESARLALRLARIAPAMQIKEVIHVVQ